MQMLELLRAHGAEIAAVVYALINLANALVSGAEAKSFLGKLADFVSFLARKDAPGTLKVPFKPKRKAKAAPPNLKPVAIIVALSIGLSACACWRPESESYNSKKCVVARQVLDCTKDSLIGLLPLLPGIAVALLSGNEIDWEAVGRAAGDKGLANAACILAAIRADFVSAEAIALSGEEPAAAAMLADKASAELKRLALRHYGGRLDIAMAPAMGKRAALLEVRP